MSEIPLIAVIDDDAGMRHSLDGLIRSLGYRVAAFASAESFLDAPEATEARCVISDLQMAGMDGISLARTLPPQLRRSFILVSAMMNEEIRATARNAGVQYVLPKPFDVEALIGYIEAGVAA